MEIVKEYDSAEKPSPDKLPEPPIDLTGHIRGVLGSAADQQINSGARGEFNIMQMLNKDLVKTSVDSAEVPSTEEKKKGAEDID